MTEEDDDFDDELDATEQAFIAWSKKQRPIDEVPGSDHERRIAWYAFREGWKAAKAALPTGDKSE